jgi:hypothetical protein
LANNGSFGESRSREDLGSDDGTFSQGYFLCISRKSDEIRAQIIREMPKADEAAFASGHNHGSL